MLPNSSVAEALNILHQQAAPLKPPKPKTVPIYDSKVGHSQLFDPNQFREISNISSKNWTQAPISSCRQNSQVYESIRRSLGFSPNFSPEEGK